MINERIKELRTERGITQQQLAAELGVSGMTISNYEQGTRKPDSDIIIKAAKYFGVSSDYLLGIINTKDKKNIDVGKSLGLNDFSIDALEISFNENDNIAGEIINNIINTTSFLRLEKEIKEKRKNKQEIDINLSYDELMDMKMSDIMKLDGYAKTDILRRLFIGEKYNLSYIQRQKINDNIDGIATVLKKKYTSYGIDEMINKYISD